MARIIYQVKHSDWFGQVRFGVQRLGLVRLGDA